jgi:hypothetical protein
MSSPELDQRSWLAEFRIMIERALGNPGAVDLIKVMLNPDRAVRYLEEIQNAGRDAARLEADRHRAELDAREAVLNAREQELERLARLA